MSLLAAFCIDLVVKHSQGAKVLFNQIVEACGKPDCKREMQQEITITRADKIKHLKAVREHRPMEIGFDIGAELRRDAEESQDKKELLTTGQTSVCISNDAYDWILPFAFVIR